MVRHSWVLILAGLSCAAEEMPTGYFRGTLVRWQGTVNAGVLSARALNGGGVFDCAFDSKTYLEFEKRRVKVDKLLEGDPLELLVHRKPGEASCYILSAEVVVPPPRPARLVKPQPPKPVKAPVRHGTRTVSGVVIRKTDASLTLRTRDGSEETFRLRRDTRFIGNGLRMDAVDLSVNQRLAAEIGRNAEGDLEAFQLTWGELSVR